MIFRTFAALLCLSAAACATPVPPLTAPLSAPKEVDAVAHEVLSKPNVAGIAIIRLIDGKTAWQGYWGEQSPGVPVGPETVFNTASVAKTIIAETTIRMADRGMLRLDDPIAEYYVHPDLGKDDRFALLTPRILLSHQAALLNWPYAYEDGKLAFTGQPGSGEITYSGAGITILMHYLEERFGRSYPELAEEFLFAPLGIKEVSVTRQPWMEGRVSQPVDKDGNRYAAFTNDTSGAIIPEGRGNPADNLFATARGYAKLLGALIEGTGLSAEMRAERQKLFSRSETALGYVCVAAPRDCPVPLGFGLGWTLFGEPDRMVLNHSGNDFAEHAQVYFSPETRDGLVVFINGGDAFEQGLEIVEAVDPDLLMAKHYRALFEKMKRQ